MGNTNELIQFLSTRAAILSGPVELSSRRFFNTLRAHRWGTGRKPDIWLEVELVISEKRFSITVGKLDFAEKPEANSSALSVAVVAQEPSCLFNGGMELAGALFIIRLCVSLHHFFDEEGNAFNLAFVRSIYLRYSRCSPMEHSCCLSLYSGVPYAACFARTSCLQTSFSQG